ncbi:MAG: Sapep family Mn(2+)-dependent dipeptidase [Synergistaceae bacterium]|nr:Sapep family Mn(2+)-dependent dipeptidase [Synergistaceae bacterium]
MNAFDGLRRKAHGLVDKYFDEQIRDTREIIKIPSVLDESGATPENIFGSDMTSALNAFLGIAESMGFRVKNIENRIGYAEVGCGAEMAGILAHLDVVPAGRLEEWTHPPFGAVVEDGVLWGRGAIDDKGPAMATLYAMKSLRDAGAAFSRRFRLILGLDEENGSRCIERYNEVEEQPAFSFSPDASFPVVNAEKGILRLIFSKRAADSRPVNQPALSGLSGGDRFNVVPDFASAFIRCGLDDRESIAKYFAGLDVSEEPDGLCVKAYGLAAHAMEPEKGENAIQKLLRRLSGVKFCDSDSETIGSLRRLFGDDSAGKGLDIAARDDVSGHLTCNTAAIETRHDGDGYKTFVIKLDIRYPVTLGAPRLIEDIRQKSSRSGYELEIAAHKPPLFVPESDPVVQTLLDSYECVMNERPAPISMGGGTYCRFMPHSVSAGPVFPGQPELAHQTDERVSLDDLRRCTHIYAEALARFNDAN